jgi:uncharacterized RDD family membrane protein YckC
MKVPVTAPAPEPAPVPRPAGMAARATAVLIDGVVALILVGLPVALLAGQAHSGNGSVGFNLHGWAALIWLALSFAYWIVCERLWGATLGKRLFSIRVESLGGGRPSWGQAVSRNLWRFADGFPYLLPYMLGFIVARSDAERARIGDNRAGTRVVSSS